MQQKRLLQSWRTPNIHGVSQEEDARWFFQQLMVGLDYCHRMGVVNRDIKLVRSHTAQHPSCRPAVGEAGCGVDPAREVRWPSLVPAMPRECSDAAVW